MPYQSRTETQSLSVACEQVYELQPGGPPWPLPASSRASAGGISGHEGQPNGPHRVIRIGVEKAIDCQFERQTASFDRHGQRRRRQQRQHVIGAVAGRAVPVNPARAPRQQPIQGRHQIRIRARAELDDHDAGRSHEARRRRSRPSPSPATNRSQAAVRSCSPRPRPVWTVKSAVFKKRSRGYGNRWRSASPHPADSPPAGADS